MGRSPRKSSWGKRVSPQPRRCCTTATPLPRCDRSRASRRPSPCSPRTPRCSPIISAPATWAPAHRRSRPRPPLPPRQRPGRARVHVCERVVAAVPQRDGRRARVRPQRRGGARVRLRPDACARGRLRDRPEQHDAPVVARRRRSSSWSSRRGATSTSPASTSPSAASCSRVRRSASAISEGPTATRSSSRAKTSRCSCARAAV